ncbi:MAG: CHAT domain-containing protein [Planctomycetales bacterium]|nr:CHAT domain-containing protein [Planctomycetales bacterium]
MEIRRFQFRNQGQKVTDDRAYVAFLIRKDTNKIARIDLGNQHKIDTAIRQLVQRLANYEPSELQAEKVDRLVIGKLRKRLAGVQLLLLAGDGMFNHLPLAVLPGTDRDYWIDEMAFAYVPSVRELVERRRPQSREAAAPAWGKKATSWLVVGDVDYGERQKPHVRLPDTAEEARFVDEVFSQLAGVPFGKEFADGHPGILMGIDPDRTTVQRLLRSRNYVHLATHGFFRQRDVDAYAIRGVAAQLDSALVLQGANDDKSGLDSLLTAEEIANLDLKHVQLVVLSACETGLGHVQAGQGTLGLVGSLQQAGVRTVLGALWKVESKATVELMKAFYRQLLARKSDFAPAFALRAAQLEMLANERYFEVPSLWAAWTVNGDPGDLPSTDR